MASYFEDTEFIIQEIIRFKKFINEGRLSEFSTYDFFSNLPAKDGRGSIICGREANKRFYSIAERAISKSPELKGKILSSELVPLLKEAFSRRIIQSNTGVTDVEITKMVRDAKYAARKKLSDITFFIPCVLSADSQKDNFSIGPVNFLSTEAACEQLAKLPTEHPKTDLDSALEYYKNFEWIAKITINQCSPDVASSKAGQILESIFDSLTAIFTISKSEGMGFENTSTSPKKTFSVTLKNGENIRVVSHFSWKQHRLSDNWLCSINDLGYGEFLDSVGRMLQPDIYDNTKYLLARRFLNSLRWFGDAAQDQNLGARIVKFTVAIENLLLTGNSKKKTQIFIQRGHALFTGRNTAIDHQAKRDLEWLYNIRSDIVHGRKPYNSVTMSDSLKAEDLCRYSLFYAIQFFQQIGLGNEKDLEKNFNELIKFNEGI